MENQHLWNVQRGTYFDRNINIITWSDDYKVNVGKYCSIGREVNFFLHADHRPDWVTTSSMLLGPVDPNIHNQLLDLGHPTCKGDINIGNDVWIGANATILSGITIHDGAVIASGAVVNKDVPPYAVVAGNPGRIVKFRFEHPQIKELLDIKWWDWSQEKIQNNVSLMWNNNIDAFIKNAKNDTNEVLIIDAFITNDGAKDKLLSFIQNLKKINIPILLVSNTVIDHDIIREVDYYLHDNNNRLFGDVFESYEKFVLFEQHENIKFNTFHYHKQPHALSVMVNLFNALNFIKDLGYTHFHRIEYDTELGDLTLGKIKETSQNVSKDGKKGYFTVNTPYNESQRFQYFFSEIEYFSQIIPLIKNQNDYLELLTKLYSECKTFQPIEKVMYDLIHNDNNLLIEEVDEAIGFKDSIWNTELSASHLEKKYQECRTSLYKGSDKDIIFSKNNKNKTVKRIISLYKNEKKVEEFIHELDISNQWIWNSLNHDVDTLVIEENGEILDTIKTKDEINYYEYIN